MNGEGYEWMRQHGKKYGWQYVYNHGPGSAHFKYVGTGAGDTLSWDLLTKTFCWSSTT